MTPFLHPNILETPSDVQLSEVPCSTKLINQFRDEGERVLVFDRHGIERTVILDKPEAAILLLDEEDRGCHWRLGWSDVS